MQILRLALPSVRRLSVYEPHLVVCERVLAPGAEWEIQLPGWCVIQVKTGHGYCLQRGATRELANGAAMLRADAAGGIIRASQLGEMALNYFRVQPDLLGGVATVGEQQLLNEMALRQEFSLKILTPEDPIAISLKNLFAKDHGGTALFRTHLLQIFLEASGNGLSHRVVELVAPADARQRLQELLRNTPVSDLLGMSFSDLAKTMNCTPRHLSRVFREVVGMSFREKQTSIRLARAREILVTTDRKIVDVALDSGYDSLSLFNLMFRRRFGTSPGKWRQQWRREDGKAAGFRGKQLRPVDTWR